MTVEQVAEAAAPDAASDALKADGTEPFLARTKRALAGAPDAPLVLLGNFEVESRGGARSPTTRPLRSARLSPVGCTGY